MDHDRLDRLARSVATAVSRRTLVGLLATLPLGGGMSAVLDPDEAGAKDRRRRRKQRHKRRKNSGKRKHPTPRKRCKSACSACFTCQKPGQRTAAACVIDPAQQGKACGSDGKVCQPDGSCTCIPTCSGRCDGAADGCGGTCTGDCDPNQLCLEGVCRPCDVCQPPAACAFAKVQDAIDATSPQRATIVVCPGAYDEQSSNVNYGLFIQRSLRLIGAGGGDDPAANTLLRPAQAGAVVVAISKPQSATQVSVTLEGVHITGGGGAIGSGVLVSSGPEVTLRHATIAGNHPTAQAGGMSIGHGASRVSLIETRIEKNSGGPAGGINVESATLQLDNLSRVTLNSSTQGPGGIRNANGKVDLPSVDNVTGNTSQVSPTNCTGSAYTGAGAVCTEG